MASGGGITWTDESLFRNLKTAPDKFDSAMAAFTTYWAPRVESYARDNAPWTDRTSNARNGLKAEPEIGRGDYAINLFHRVPYGIWLEVRHNGRYAIILPTIKVMGREVMSSARDLLRRMR